jgi:hypothetical protein
MKTNVRLTASCRCGGVEIEATGAPIVNSVCYCADCQRGSRQIEDLPGAGSVRDDDGGTAYIVFRKDRIKCAKGADLAGIRVHRSAGPSDADRLPALGIKRRLSRLLTK